MAIGVNMHGTRELPFKTDDLVDVEARTFPGICSYGGAGRIQKCYHDKFGNVFVDVLYINESKVEKHVEVIEFTFLVKFSLILL